MPALGPREDVWGLAALLAAAKERYDSRRFGECELFESDSGFNMLCVLDSPKNPMKG